MIGIKSMSLDKTTLKSLRIDRDRPPSKTKRTGLIGAVLLLVILVLGFKFSQGKAVTVKTAVARETSGGRAQTVLNASGYVTARRQATVSSKTTAKVAEVLVEEGFKVEAGQVLAKLDEVNIAAGLRLAEAQLAAAEASLQETKVRLEETQNEWERIRQLATNQISSVSDGDHAKAEYQARKAQLARQDMDVVVARRQVEMLRQELDDLVIRAPFAGIVISKNAQPGEMISPISAGGGFTRTGICTLVDMASLEVEVDVNESFIGRVKARQAVSSTLDAYPDWHIPSKVIAIIPTADRQKATVKVRIGFDQLDPRMLPDMGVKVEFKADGTEGKSGGVIVPKSAVRLKEGRSRVLVVKDGRIEPRPVTLGDTREQEATVETGLAAGERVVIEGPESLESGAKVREN